MSNRNCHFCGKPNWSLEPICPARRAQCNNCKKMGHFAKMCKSKTVSRIQKEPSTHSNTESGPEIDHVQSVNGINWIDFYKAILLVQGQPIEFIIDTGSPVTIIPPIIIGNTQNHEKLCRRKQKSNNIQRRGHGRSEKGKKTE